MRNLVADGRTSTDQASRFRTATDRAFPEAIVEPPSGLADQLGCDPGDRHVLDAAIGAKAEVIGTLNLNVRQLPSVVLMGRAVVVADGTEAVGGAEGLVMG